MGTENPSHDHATTMITDAIIEANRVLNQNSSILVSSLNVTDNSQDICNNCTEICRDGTTKCGLGQSSLANTPWYWFVVVALMICLVVMGAGLGIWICVDEWKIRQIRKKRAEKRAALEGLASR
ncbi:hypothetical protein EG329_008103 [Mollisiaceae sp. DMI_Dod_QoI]|nr:hypothetical protein EG329_008103 [Helotiales sp. DMI_Dod_QoI]